MTPFLILHSLYQNCIIVYLTDYAVHGKRSKGSLLYKYACVLITGYDTDTYSMIICLSLANTSSYL